jgi:drug/metabolite transporter (DMT)-like permease
MISEHAGEFYALIVAFFWTITALSFESASKKIGSLPVNLIRLFLGLVFLSILNWIFRGLPLPVDASAHNWIWLSVSGLIGFVFGDLFLFKSYTIVGSWFAMLIMTLAPPMAAIFGWLILDETMKAGSLLGMFLTLLGITITIFSRGEDGEKFRIKKPFIGILYAFGGALGQALGIVFSKYGMLTYHPFAATQIRIITGVIGFAAIVTLMRRWPSIFKAFKDKPAILATLNGSFFGPFLGVSFSLMAIRYTTTGIASTIMAMVPIFIIAPSVILFKHKITKREIIGSIISVIGVALFFF